MVSPFLSASPSNASAASREIEDLLEELTSLSRSAISAGEFYRLLLERVVRALGGIGAAVWSCDQGRLPRVVERISFPTLDDMASLAEVEVHRQLVVEAFSTNQPRIVAWPHGESERNGHSSESPSLLIVQPFRNGQSSGGVLEIWQRPGTSGAAQRGFLSFLGAVAELAADFEERRELRQLRDRESLWGHFQQFAQQVHASLDVDQAAYCIANDGRRLIGCDRLAVLLRCGSKYRALAVSGSDQIDRRANVIRLLERLATRAMVAGEPIWNCGATVALSDQVSQALDAYLDEAHVRSLSIVPLVRKPQGDARSTSRLIGALVVEHFQADDDSGAVQQRATAVAEQSSIALDNALHHACAPVLAPVRAWNALRWRTRLRRVPLKWLALVIVAAVLAALSLIPADFEVHVGGELQPLRRRNVFATADGVVEQLRVQHGQAVDEGTPLLSLRRPELDLEFRRVLGEMQTAQKRLAAIQAERLSNNPATADSTRSAHQLAAEEEEIKELLKSLEGQQEILDRQRQELQVTSPMQGQVITWNLQQLLEARPVMRGQALLTVADLNGPWVVELQVPDHAVGHVLRAREELESDLPVRFTLITEPGKKSEGRLSELGLSTEQDQAGTPSVRAVVAFDRQQVTGLRPGATVTARVYCGRRALGYVWLHDLFEAVQTRFW